ncbi:hypothetical protein [Actinoplanes sp. DH11]|uniref:hypothetical protein n=1 Tax=Actinoplanes sp. DH11 TaxID=2857011 RepID=UPI001E2E7593|nr:hypothetical protein [Actinoplanes sp. DH11]
MHHGNHFYGHAHVLAEYCGLDPADPPRIDGYLQHGWNVVDGLGAGTPYAPGRPIFVWSERTRRRAWSMNRPLATVIGAPFLYLLSAQSEPDAASAQSDPDAGGEREGTIWYPFHGWEGQHVDGDHQRLIDEIVATEPGPITFCLYWHEFRDARIRAAYEKAGRVICHGYRGYMRMQTDARFLHKQLAELRRHRRVASNRLSSAVFYGVAAGCEPAVYGNPMRLAKEDGPTARRIPREWPELHGTNPDVTAARATAMAELGAGHLASPAELRAVLGWTAGREMREAA